VGGGADGAQKVEVSNVRGGIFWGEKKKYAKSWRTIDLKLDARTI